MTEIHVRVPADTPSDARLFLTGDSAKFGPWRADALPLERRSDGTFVARLDCNNLHYLITRGSWRTVEARAGAIERLPRRLPPKSHLAGLTVGGWGRHSIRYHHDFASFDVKNSRTITVYVPPGYDRISTRQYPVFYLHDGQNLFDASTAFGGVPWGIDETAERLIRCNEIEPIVLVGIANTKRRLAEYGPTGRSTRRNSRAYRYGQWIVEQVKPFIDSTYRTLPDRAHTAIGGSSMGGLISLFLARWFPETFGLCMAMSPALWWDREVLFRTWPADRSWMSGLKVWIDMGTEEGGSSADRRAHVRRARKLAQMVDGGSTPVRFVEAMGGRHNERDWGNRFERVLQFFFGTTS